MQNAFSSFNAVTLLQHRSVLDLDIEQMQFLIPLPYLPRFINPYQGIFDLLSSWCGLMDTDVDCEMGGRSCLLQAFYEGTLRCGKD